MLVRLGIFITGSFLINPKVPNEEDKIYTLVLKSLKTA